MDASLPSPAEDGTGPEPGAARGKRRSPLRIVALLVRFGRPHRATFLKGCAAAIFMVAARLAMPWPAHELMHHWKVTEGAAAAAPRMLGMERTLTLGIAFLVLLAALGLGDALVRVLFARFSISTLRDVRNAAIQAALGAAAGQPRVVDGAGDSKATRSGDLVTRLVGDTARVKAGLKGFLVHVVPAGGLFAGVTVVLYLLDFKLGLILGAAGLGVLAVTAFGARAMYRLSKKYRKKEGKLADRIDRSLREGALESGFDEVNAASGKAEAGLTRLQSMTTWSAYVLFGLAVLGIVQVGSHEIAAGRLEPRDMVLFLMYALILRGPTIRLARQGARLGKTFGAARRILKVVERSPSGPHAVPDGDVSLPAGS